MKKILFVFLIAISLGLSNMSVAENIPHRNNPTFNFDDATVDSIHVAIKKHHITCEQLITLYWERIKKYNLSSRKKAPINAFTTINQNVIDQARALDEVYSHTQQFSGSLHCVPVVLKDNIDSYDSTTSSGTLALLGNLALR